MMPVIRELHPRLVLGGPERGHVFFVHLVDFGIVDGQHHPSSGVLLETGAE